MSKLNEAIERARKRLKSLAPNYNNPQDTGHVTFWALDSMLEELKEPTEQGKCSACADMMFPPKVCPDAKPEPCKHSAEPSNQAVFDLIRRESWFTASRIPTHYDIWKTSQKIMGLLSKPSTEPNYKRMYSEAQSLIDGVYEIVELYGSKYPAQVEWKKRWLENARKHGASGE